jgi:dolichol-phosphate mannosyltransferase
MKKAKININKISLAVVCPMANERESAESFVTSVLEKCDDFKAVTFLAILDNASKDGTLDILNNLQKTQPKLNVVWAPENKCVVDAYMRGYKEALSTGCDWILEIDAGFSHQPSGIPSFFEKMSEGYDCVFATRFAKGGQMLESPLSRRIISKGGSLLANLLLGTKLSDMTSGFEMFTHNALEMVLKKGINSKGHFFQTEIKVHCRKLNFAEVPIQYRSPSASVNNKVLQDAFSNLLRMSTLRFTGKL